MLEINWKQQSTIGRACGTALRSRLTLRLARGEQRLNHLPYIPRVGILRIKRCDVQRVRWSQKSEIFFSTRNSFIFNNQKLASKSSYSSTYCFNYENLTHCLSVFTRACSDFACAISRCARRGTNITGWSASGGGGPRCAGGSESRCASCDESGCAGSNGERPARRISRCASGSGHRYVKPRSRKPAASC